ncbi:inverse autotransporter beta domain-containing protein [Erwinia sp. CGal63]|uniref:inverse autotransporter beta domain-containing protein n=1 Tax=Erwinia sp. CGal63 TaxID=2919889 RepID=UPI00300A1223
MKNKPEVNNKPQWLHRLTWLTVAIQGAFPVACAFTPVLAAAQQHFLAPSADAVAIRTQLYTLGEAETVSSVAQKYNMSVEALRKLNQLRTFAHGFDRLQAGDELEVPLSPLPKVHWHNDNTLPMKAASLAAQAGSALDGNGAASAAANMAAGEAGAQAQQWLSRFGTARVQLDTDKKFSLKNSQFDLLLPLSDRADRLIFTQGSFHRTDDRNQANLGLGIRHFGQGFMTGANAFFDYDLSRQHARSGMGVEYWRDFFKLAANGYVRLTSWKDSKDFSGYEERPANGWDIRTEAFLPALPQLGAKLNYEQYYGNDVALFSKDNRQKNPHAITAGVTFTPVPLLTLEAEQRQGKAGEHDTRLGLSLNYQIGMPWRKQLDSDAVATLRSLAGNRYDLVNRNNNIVLEYRKEEVIKLSAAKLITGTAGEQKTLNVSVNSKYGLERINWSASALIANGGKIVAHSPTDYSVVLPAYHADATGVNSYTLSGVAIDKKGNASKRTETQITVTEANINVNSSSLLPVSSTLSADGHAQQTLTLTVKDGLGNPVDINEKEISVTKSVQGADEAKISGFTRQSAGRYTAVVTAGTHPETLTITPVARNMTFPSATVAIAADTASVRLASLSVESDNAVADGKTADRVKAVVTDAQGNPLANQSVTFSADNNAVITQSVMTDDRGEASVPVTSTKAGLSHVVAQVGATQKEADVNFVAGEATSIYMHRLTGRAVADGTATSRVEIYVKDSNGNPVANRKVAITATDSRVNIPSEVTLDQYGAARFDTTSNHDGGWEVDATIDGHKSSIIVYFYAGYPTVNNSSFTVSSSSAPADGVSAITLTIVARDMRNNAVKVKGLPDLINFDISGLPGSRLSEVKVNGNVYTAQLTSTQPVSGTVRANLMLNRGVLPIKVTFTPPAK